MPKTDKTSLEQAIDHCERLRKIAHREDDAQTESIVTKCYTQLLILHAERLDGRKP